MNGLLRHTSNIYKGLQSQAFPTADLIGNYNFQLLNNINEDYYAATLYPCANFDGTNYLKGESLLDADEVEIKFKTTSLARMGLIGVNGYGTIILDNNEVIAGTSSVFGNSALCTYNDGNWHTVNLKKTETANIFDITFDDELKSKTSDGSWRDSTLTYIGCASNISLLFDGQISYIELKTDSVTTNKWVFIEGENSQYVYDTVGSFNMEWSDVRMENYTIDADVYDFGRLDGASLCLSDTSNVVLLPYLNGTKRTLPFFFTEILVSIENYLPKVSYGINFNPTESEDSYFNLFDKTNLTVFSDYISSDNLPNYTFRTSDLDLTILTNLYNSDYKYRIFPKCNPNSIGTSYYIQQILIYSTNQESNLLNFTNDIRNLIDFDTWKFSIDTKQSNVITNIKGGLTTRLYPDQDVANIFTNNGFKASFVVRTPADYRDNSVYKALLKNIQDAGHDVGFWFDMQMSLIKLYDPDWFSDFEALDTNLLNTFDEYSSPLWGIEEVIEYDGETYLGLNAQIRHKVDDAIIQPVDGTDKIKITNIPESSLLSNFMVFLPDNSLIPESLRNKWVYCGTPSDQTPTNREFPILLFEEFTMAQYGAGTFTNPTNDTLVTSVGLDMEESGGSYVSYNRLPQSTNGINERARYYTYLYAQMAWDEMGLNAPDIVGEPRNIVNHDCLSTDPLTELNYIAGTVDPTSYGHTINMIDRYRWNFSTKASGSFTDPIDESGTDNSINFNTDLATQFTAAQAFSRVLYNYGRNRWIMERQASEYDAGTLTKWDDLLQLCAANNIPVKSLSEVGNILFDSSYAANTNIFPLVHVDNNSDGIPDGYYDNASGTTWQVNEVNGNIDSGYGYFKRSVNGQLAKVPFMGGILQGKNMSYLWAYGKIGDKLNAVIKKYIYNVDENVRIDSSISQPITETITFELTSTDTWHKVYPDRFLYSIKGSYFNTITINLEKGLTAGDVYLGQLFIKK
jgi:hypothetical protein